MFRPLLGLTSFGVGTAAGAFERLPRTNCFATQDQGDETGEGGGPRQAAGRPDTFVLIPGIRRPKKPGGNQQGLQRLHGLTATAIFDYHLNRPNRINRETVAAALAAGDDKLRAYSDAIRRQVEIGRHNEQIKDYIRGLSPEEARVLFIELCTGTQEFSDLVLPMLVGRIFGMSSREHMYAAISVLNLSSGGNGILVGGSESILEFARSMKLIS